MSEIMNRMTQLMTGGGLQDMSMQIGESEGKTSSAVSAALPILISALAKNASTPSGAQALHGALASHDGSILDNLEGFMSGAGSGPGQAILGHVLGNRNDAVQSSIAKASGINLQSAGTLMAMLAPMVMGALGRHASENKLDASSLAGMLGREQKSVAASAPDIAGLASRLLDQNADKSILDDVGGLLGKFLGGS